MLVPLHDRAKIGRNQFIDIVAACAGKHLRALHQETRTGIIAPPISQRREYRVARLHHTTGWAVYPQGRTLTADENRVAAQRKADGRLHLEFFDRSNPRSFAQPHVPPALRTARYCESMS